MCIYFPVEDEAQEIEPEQPDIPCPGMSLVRWMAPISQYFHLQKGRDYCMSIRKSGHLAMQLATGFSGIFIGIIYVFF